MRGGVDKYWSLPLYCGWLMRVRTHTPSRLTSVQSSPIQTDWLHSQSYFTTSSLPPVSSSWRKNPWGS
jgi:hypothetical protein